MTQMTIFGDAETLKKARKVHVNSSGNPIVFRDYASFVAKFTEQPKTTDDCYTPEDVYNAVVDYVGTITDMTGRMTDKEQRPNPDRSWMAATRRGLTAIFENLSLIGIIDGR